MPKGHTLLSRRKSLGNLPDAMVEHRTGEVSSAICPARHLLKVSRIYSDNSLLGCSIFDRSIISCEVVTKGLVSCSCNFSAMIMNGNALICIGIRKMTAIKCWTWVILGSGLEPEISQCFHFVSGGCEGVRGWRGGAVRVRDGERDEERENERMRKTREGERGVREEVSEGISRVRY